MSQTEQVSDLKIFFGNNVITFVRHNDNKPFHTSCGYSLPKFLKNEDIDENYFNDLSETKQSEIVTNLLHLKWNK